MEYGSSRHYGYTPRGARRGAPRGAGRAGFRGNFRPAYRGAHRGAYRGAHRGASKEEFKNAFKANHQDYYDHPEQDSNFVIPEKYSRASKHKTKLCSEYEQDGE